MKRQLLFLTLALSPTLLFAQTIKAKAEENFRNRPDSKLLQSILQKQTSSSSSAKTTALPKRLTAVAYTSNGVLQDSNQYYYSDGRGSNLSNVYSYYDSYYPTAQNDTKTIFCDSSINWHKNGPSFMKQNTKIYEYDSDNKVTHMELIDYARSIYDISYNSNGQRTSVITQDTFGSSAMIPKSKMYVSYDGNNRHLLDSFVSVIINTPTYKTQYIYDTSGNLITSLSYGKNNNAWYISYKVVYSYDTLNRLTGTIRSIDFTGTGLVNNTRDSFGYTGTNTNYSYFSYYDWDGNTNSWRPEYMYRYQYNAQNSVDTYYIHSWNGYWDTTERDVYYYNSDGTMQSTHGFNYLGNGIFDANYYDQTSYYYEEYFPAGVSNITVKEELSIYPNPALNTLNINMKQGNGTISIINIQGQLMLRLEQMPLNHAAIDISSLPQGNYIIQLKATNGYISQKQFVKI